MTFLILLVMLVVLTACFSLLLPGMDPAGRAIVSAAAAVCILTLIAQAMLTFGLWSPGAGLVVAGVVCALLAGTGRVLHPRSARPAAPSRPAAPPAPEPQPEPAKITRHDGVPLPKRSEDGEEWIYRS
ncbi:hypothetical protein DPM19_24560 [Actinomadura craniellae]|uniref:Uncharacterized protein n=1 Tax=Actinomadura craniellae TaxID=2231787 RepID=A0A365GZS8_9ACTN|nr:hypothetical protein [Actinomadura craniellae]RAY12330.1 hypothetical protein DPM19_24560 [Actinomadura craniellae]